MIKKVGGKFKLFTRDGKRLLGTHDSYKEAAAQESKIKREVKRRRRK